LKKKVTRSEIEIERARLRGLADDGEDPKPVDIRDTERPGLVARVTKTGMVTFYLDYRNSGGQRRWLKLGRYGPEFGISKARASALKYQNNVLEGQDPRRDRQDEREAAARTLGSFIEGPFTNQVNAELRSADTLLARLKANFAPWWGDAISGVTKSRVRDWRTVRLNAGVKPATVNRDVAALSSVLSAAAAAGIIPRNPVARELKPLKVDRNARCRYLKPDELARLMEAMKARDRKMAEKRASANAWRKGRGYPLLPSLKSYGDHLTPIVILALNTGMRRGELLGLQWRNVNLENNVITLAGEQDESGGGGTKSGRTRHIPMSKAVREAVEAWKEQQGEVWPAGFVFPGPGGERMKSLKTAFTRLLKDARIKDFRFHDCRHHFCSMLVQRGVPLAKVKELAGHSTIQLTERYAHLAPDDLTAAIAVLDQPGNVRAI